MRNCAKIVIIVIGIVVALAWCAEKVKIGPNTFLFTFFSDNTAYFDESSKRLSVALDHSRQWIDGIEDEESSEIVFFLPAGSNCSQIYSLGDGSFVRPDEVLNSGKRIRVLEDHTLPSVFVSTELTRSQLIEDRNIETTGRVQVYSAEGAELRSAPISFKGHGNGSWEHNDKKSWLIKFSEDTSVLGMRAGRGYVALANAHDGSSLRNHVTFELARNMNMVDTPDDQFVNLYLNGDYQGLYTLATRIEASSERLTSVQRENQDDVASVSATEAFGSEDLDYVHNEEIKAYVYPQNVSLDAEDTGFLFVQVATFGEDRYARADVGFRVGEEVQMRVIYPKRASVDQTYALRSRYTGFLDALKRAIDTEGSDRPDTTYLHYIDVDSFARKHLLEQFVKNHDANAASSYFSIRNLKDEPVIYEGPAWDYDIAFGNRKDNADWRNPKGYVHFPPGLTRLSAFTSLQNSLYIQYLKPYLEKQFEADLLTSVSQITESAKMDCRRWPDNRYRQGTFEDEVENLLGFVRERKAFFDETILEGKVFHRVNFVDEDSVVGCCYIENGSSLQEETSLLQSDYPDSFGAPSDTGGKTFAGWFEEDMETPADFLQSLTDDQAYYALWKETD